MIRDDPKEFYEAIIDLKNNWTKVEKLSQHAYDFAKRNHDLNKIIQKKKEIYEYITKR